MKTVNWKEIVVNIVIFATTFADQNVSSKNKNNHDFLESNKNMFISDSLTLSSSLLSDIHDRFCFRCYKQS